MRNLRAYRTDGGAEVVPGETITDFRGDPAAFHAATRANEPGGRDGKVQVGGQSGPEYYARVFGLAVTDVLHNYAASGQEIQPWS